MKNKALSLLEVLIATILLTLTFAGLAGVFVSGKKYLAHSRTRIASGEFGKLFVDPINLDVKQSSWSLTAPGGADFTNMLKRGVVSPSATITQDLSKYSVRYDVQVPPSMAATSQMRKMIITISVTEPDP